ncbi:MAG: hypothetical protein AAB263_00655 [Planctomycetota bacterium]
MTITDNQLPLPMGKTVALTIIKNGKSTELPSLTIVDNTTGSAEPAWSLDEPVTSPDGIITVVGFFQSASSLTITQARAEMSARMAALKPHTVTNTQVIDKQPGDAPAGGMVMMHSSASSTRTTISGNVKKIAQETVCTISADGTSAPAIRARASDKSESWRYTASKQVAGQPLTRCWVRISFRTEADTPKDDEARKKAKADAERNLKDFDALIDKQMEHSSEKK